MIVICMIIFIVLNEIMTESRLIRSKLRNLEMHPRKEHGGRI